MAIERRSRKREALLELLRSVDCHPSADWLCRRLRRDFPGLSLATVYRNLRQLQAEGLIVSVGVVDGQERFDGTVAPHGHFICTRCGAVSDVPIPPDPAEIARVEAAVEGRVEARRVEFTGICRSCAGADMQA